MILPVFALLVLQLVGEVFVRAIGLPIPGPVVGLVLLVLAMAARRDLEEMLRPVTQTLLGNLSLLFVPAGVGVVGHLDTLHDSGAVLIAIITISTALAIVTGAWTFSVFAREPSRKDAR